MKKSIIKVLLCIITLIMITNLLFVPVSAATNPYPSSQTINGVTTVPCTYYAWQQVYDRLGKTLPNWGNAINWLDRAASAGYSTGSVAKANSIAVWKSSAHSYGHVSFVTAVNGNYMTVNEGGMTNSSGGAANGTGIVTGSTVSSVVGTKKSAYSSCTLLGFIYLTGAPSTTVNISSYTSKNSIAEKNAILWGKVDKPSSYSVTKIGIKVRVDGGSYSSAWSKYEAPSKSYVGETVMYPYYNLKDELGLTLTHATKYYYQFYALVNGKEYWSAELSFTTTGSHTYGSWSTTKAATCTASGTKTRKCSCSATQTETIAALGHNYSSSYTVDKAATCTAKGSKSKHCSRCSSTTSVTEIAATGHSYSSWTVTKEATCTQTGTKTRKCSSCSNTETETISAKGHDYSTAWTVDNASTCTVAGSKSHHCSRCDAKTDISTVSAIGHTWSEWSVTKEATTESVGEKVRTCTRSGCTEKEKATIAKLAADGHTHNFGEWKTITEATCVTDGTEQRECSVCKEIESMTVTAKGHIFSDWNTVTEATADTNGLIERTCDICGKKESEEVLKTGVDSAENSISNDDKNEKITKTKAGINIWFLIIAGVSLSTLIIICIMLYKKKKN